MVDGINPAVSTTVEPKKTNKGKGYGTAIGVVSGGATGHFISKGLLDYSGHKKELSDTDLFRKNTIAEMKQTYKICEMPFDESTMTKEIEETIAKRKKVMTELLPKLKSAHIKGVAVYAAFVGLIGLGIGAIVDHVKNKKNKEVETT